MNVEMELVSHPKYRALRRFVGPEAMEILVRLWGHCASNKRGEFWPNATPEYVEDVCNWEGTPGALFTALTTVGFLDEPEEGRGVVVHDWNEQNSFTVQNWNRNPSGRRGKTTGKTMAQPTVPAAEPVASPRTSHGQPLRVSDKSEENEESEGGGSARALEEVPEIPAAGDIPAAGEEPHIPSELEFMGAFFTESIPADYVRRQFTWFQASPKRWLDRGDLVNWKWVVRRRWAQDRATWTPTLTGNPAGGANSAGGGTGDQKNGALTVRHQVVLVDKELAEIEAAMQSQHELGLPVKPEDRARKALLKKRRAELLGEWK